MSATLSIHQYSEVIPEIIRRLRVRHHLSRGQVARRIGLSPTVVYNLETGRTRLELATFIALLEAVRIDAGSMMRRHLFAIDGIDDVNPAAIVRSFRNRLGLSQAKLGKALGYRSGSIVHHFEKGIRQPSLEDYFKLMTEAGDNVRGLVLELTEDLEFSQRFPVGKEAVHTEWHEYWEYFYVQGIHQMMRTRLYESMGRYNPGLFAGVLNISYQQERHGLRVLKELDLIRWQDAKPLVNRETKILMPKDIAKEKLDSLKARWQKFSKEHYLQGDPSNTLSTFDLVPVNQEMFLKIKQKIRALQDELHNLRQGETDGFVYLGWLANYVKI